jgi:lysophospholipase L1-like esterase
MAMTESIEKLDRNFAPCQSDGDRQWYDIRDIGVEGRGYHDTRHDFDRFPARAQAMVPDVVWDLSQCGAGMTVRFVTDAPTVAARWSLRFEAMAMDHLAATAMSGLDLYVRDDAGRWRWVGLGRPTKQIGNDAMLIKEDMSPGKREFMLYLPLYNGVESVSIGLPTGSTIEPAPAWKDNKRRPICFYGSSIVQGGCAARPGMAYPAIISRRLDHPHYNFGFSGNGKAEVEVAQLLGELNPAAYILDPVPNLTKELIVERIEPFVHTLRAVHAATPIVLVENVPYQQAAFVPGIAERLKAFNDALRDAFDRLITSGVANLHLVPGDALLGDDGEATVDGTHPTDLGFLRMADVLMPVIAPLV